MTFVKTPSIWRSLDKCPDFSQRISDSVVIDCCMVQFLRNSSIYPNMKQVMQTLVIVFTQFFFLSLHETNNMTANTT